MSTGVNLLRVTCTIVSVNTWIAFALSAVSMVTAVAWSHGCHFLDVGLRDGWAVAGLDGQSSAILDGCIGSGAAGSVFDVFNFTERLGFVESYADVVAKVRGRCVGRAFYFSRYFLFLSLYSSVQRVIVPRVCDAQHDTRKRERVDLGRCCSSCVQVQKRYTPTSDEY